MQERKYLSINTLIEQREDSYTKSLNVQLPSGTKNIISAESSPPILSYRKVSSGIYFHLTLKLIINYLDTEHTRRLFTHSLELSHFLLFENTAKKIQSMELTQGSKIGMVKVTPELLAIKAHICVSTLLTQREKINLSEFLDKNGCLPITPTPHGKLSVPSVGTIKVEIF